MKPSVPRIVMLVENHYPADTRVKNEATLLQSAGYQVSVVSLREGSGPWSEVLDGVRIYRLPRIELFKKTLADRPGTFGNLMLSLKALIGYGFEYLYFTTGCLVVTGYILCATDSTRFMRIIHPIRFSSLRFPSNYWERNSSSIIMIFVLSCTSHAIRLANALRRVFYLPLNGAHSGWQT